MLSSPPDFPRLARSILKIAWPIALARLGIMGMGVADTVMVGQLAPDQLAYQALGWAPTSVFMVAGIGLLMGVQVLAARVMGQGEQAAAGVVWRRGIVIGLVFGAIAVGLLWAFGGGLLRVFGVSPALVEPATKVMAVLALSLPLHLIYVASAFFLEAIRRPMASTVIMWIANILNVGLNFWLIPHLGAEGSAWATVGARVFLAGSIVVWILSLKDARALGARGATRAVGPSYRALLGVGIAAAVSQAVEAAAFSGMTILAGRIGEDAVSGYAILLNLLAVVFMVALGLSAASAVVVSEEIGRDDRPTAGKAAWTGLGLNSIAMAAAGIVMLVLGNALSRAFTADLALAAVVAAQMGWAAAILIPDGGQVVTASTLRARGDNWVPTASHIAAYAFLMPVLGWYLAEHMGQGLAGLMAAIFWASVLSFGVLALRQWFVIRRG